MPAPLTIGSLFSGIGGLDLGAEWAMGARTIWQLDEVGDDVRARHWPDALQVAEDVADVEPASLTRPDILTAGFSCQDLSCAGSGASREDLEAGARTGATWRGVVDFVAVLQPRFVVLENVRALAGLLDQVQAGLPGYGLSWCLLRAQDVGHPHRRARCFVLAERGAWGRGRVEVPPLSPWSPVGDERAWATMAAGNFNEGEDPATWHARRAELAARHGNNGAGEPLAQQVRLWPTARAYDGRSPGPSSTRDGGPDLAEAVRPWPTALAADAKMVKQHGPGSPALNYEARTADGSRLNPAWVERLMGLPEGWTLPEGPRLVAERAPPTVRGRYPEGWDRSVYWPGYAWEPRRTLPDGPPAPGRPARLKALGNMAVPQQVAAAISGLMRPQQRSLFAQPAFSATSDRLA